MNIGDRIKALRIKKSMTQKEVGDELGVSEVSIRNWENGSKNPSMNSIIPLAEVLGVSTDYLLGVKQDEKRDSYLLSAQEKALLKKYRALDKYGRRAVDGICDIEYSRLRNSLSNFAYEHINPEHTQNKYIPRYKTPAASGGAAPFASDDFEMILVDDSIPEEADFAMKIQGDSMRPYISDGDTVYVDKNSEIEIGDIGIFLVDGLIYCKQYYIDDENNLILVSSNEKFKSTNVFLREDCGSEVRCFGKVILPYKPNLPPYMFK